MALSIVNDVKEAKRLLEKGVITEIEYQNVKRILISKANAKEKHNCIHRFRKWLKC